MEKYSCYSRTELETDGKTLRSAWEDYKYKLIAEVKYLLTPEHELYCYKDKNITEYTDAFAHLHDVVITKHNAFLLRPDRI